MEHRQHSDYWIDDNTYFLQPGAIFFSSGSGAVRTVLGNGVAVCIWDRKTKSGGMSYFIYPSIKEASRATPRYGNAGILSLVKIMIDAGGDISDFSAQIIGGAIPGHDEDNLLGLDNVEIAKKILEKKGIKIVSEDIGGNMGRKIIFDISTGHAAVYKVHKIRAEDWWEKEAG